METQTVLNEGTYSYGYDELGRNNALTFPDGHVRRQQYDELGRVTSRCYDYGLGEVRCYTASYDAVGNPVRMTDPDGVDVLEYDALDRLKKVTRYAPDGVTQLGVEDYAYNALGALKVNAGVALDDQRPRLDGTGFADAAVPNSLGGQPVTLDAGGFVTSLRGASFGYSQRGLLTSAADPVPASPEQYLYDAQLRRFQRVIGGQSEFYVFEGLDRVAILNGAPLGVGVFVPDQIVETYLFDGIDHPLRIKRGSNVVYYELDLAGNVRGLHASAGSDLGGYRYTAFGKTVEDTTTFDQPLRWKGRWFSNIAGGIYDVRARQWSPEMGAFLTVDEFIFHDRKSTLWGWPRQSPARFRDPSGQFVWVCHETADLPILGWLGYQHEWIATSDEEAGQEEDPDRGGLSTRICNMSHHGRRHRPGVQCELLSYPVDEDCVNKVLRSCRNEGWWSPFNTCQDVAERALTECAIKGPYGKGFTAY